MVYNFILKFNLILQFFYINKIILTKIWNKNKVRSFFFHVNIFNEENFVEFVLSNFKIDITYSLLLKINYFTLSPDKFVFNTNPSYGMTGK